MQTGVRRHSERDALKITTSYRRSYKDLYIYLYFIQYNDIYLLNTYEYSYYGHAPIDLIMKGYKHLDVITNISKVIIVNQAFPFYSIISTQFVILSF